MNDITITGGGRTIHTDSETLKRTAARAAKNTKTAAKDKKPAPGNSGGVSGGQLKSIVERIERLEEEKATIAADISDIYTEAKANGFDVKVLRQVVKLRKMDATEREEQESLLDVYKHALGMA